ncbi:MAG TPA: ABC transporter permease [Solirubrobacterales bacterium]|nr:ABC transporter permease [Solirubrobacterales bacterium]
MTGFGTTAENPELRDVRGPSATGGGWRRFADLLYLIAVTDFKKSYFGTVLGYFWSLARPVLLFAVLLAVFTQVFRIGSQVENYPVLLLLNIVMFGFFQEATVAAVTSVVAQEGVVRKTQFPRLVIPLAVVLTALFNLGMNLIAVFAFILAYGVEPAWTWLLFPLPAVALFVFTTAVAMILSSLYVRFRDVAIIWSVLVAVLFYGTPILYPLEVVPDTLHDFLMVNPLTPIFEQMRAWIIDPGAPGAVDAAGGVLYLLPALAMYMGICALAVWVFNREAPRIAEEL